MTIGNRQNGIVNGQLVKIPVLDFKEREQELNFLEPNKHSHICQNCPHFNPVSYFHTYILPIQLCLANKSFLSVCLDLCDIAGGVKTKLSSSLRSGLNINLLGNLFKDLFAVDIAGV